VKKKNSPKFCSWYNLTVTASPFIKRIFLNEIFFGRYIYNGYSSGMGFGKNRIIVKKAKKKQSLFSKN